jgi:predicted alpha/beta hydrolase
MVELVTQATGNTDTILLAGLAAAAVAGVVTGVLYRMAAVLIASLATVIAVGVIGVGEGWTVWRIVLVAFALITALQIGYLLGVALLLSGDRLRGGVARGWRRVGVLDEDARGKRAGEPPEG